MSNKHAYLIMAHNDFAILENLIDLLDDKRNDIFIHIDKKVKDFDFEYFKKLSLYSKIKFVDRIDTRWGDFSLVEAELALLKHATDGCYTYYHLLSGVDIPIKSQDYIHNFFEKNNGKEFIHFTSMEEAKSVEYRVKNYHFMKYVKTNKSFVNLFGRTMNLILKWFHKITNFERNWPEDYKLAYGSQWFSITNELAKYIVSNEEMIKKLFSNSYCSDELLVQTIVYNSKFIKSLYLKELNNNYEGCLRLIDWKRGTPYIFRIEDYEELIESDCLFARKFSSEVDKKVINKLYNHFKI